MSEGGSDTSSVGSSKAPGGDKKTDEQDSHNQQEAEQEDNKPSMTKHKHKHKHKNDDRKKRRLIANFEPTRQQEIREANRVAARICRKRKKQFSQSLEATLKVLGEENQHLTSQHDTLSSWVKMVRQEAAIPATRTANGLDTQERTETTGSAQDEETGASTRQESNDTRTTSSSAPQFQEESASPRPFHQQDKNGTTTIDTSDSNVMPPVPTLPIPVYNTASFQNAMYDNSLYPQTSFLQQTPSSQDRSAFLLQQHQQQQQQQQQQNFFQQNLFPGSAFGTNTNALPISMMMQMQNLSGMPGALVPNNGRQMSSMMTSMVGLPPSTAPARDSSNIAYMQQGLSALMGNQQYLGLSQSNQNPNFMQGGGWNAGMTMTRSRPLQQQQDTVPNEVGTGSQQQQQLNPDFGSMNNFSHYQQI